MACFKLINTTSRLGAGKGGRNTSQNHLI